MFQRCLYTGFRAGRKKKRDTHPFPHFKSPPMNDAQVYKLTTGAQVLPRQTRSPIRGNKSL